MSDLIRTKATLLRPVDVPRSSTWSFIVLPKAASERLPTRGATAVKGTLNGAPFRATIAPDGQKSHWLKVNRKLREAAGAAVGDVVALAIEPAAPIAPRVPADLRSALDAAPAAKAVWPDLTPKARRDWIDWITSAKRKETRARRIDSACDMLASGKRRVCCFDRSGVYGKNFNAPKGEAR